ncbi:MAG: HipA N-terminal domain-containing protein [Lachnospiraceae bacterium]|nr:HipA N-terminal domain-containing protein [Lachnospiraceae bacterium]
MDQNKTYVYAGWEDNIKIGTIFSDILNGTEVVSFAYEQEWLQKHPFLILDPTFEQSPYRFYSKDRILFGAFQDSCPDRWGRKLIDRRESIYAEKEGRRPQKFTETGYLLRLQDITRSGAFRFKTNEQGGLLS